MGLVIMLVSFQRRLSFWDTVGPFVATREKKCPFHRNEAINLKSPFAVLLITDFISTVYK